MLGVPVADLAAAVAGVVASAHTRETAVKSGRDAEVPLAQVTGLAEEGVGKGGRGGSSAGGEGERTSTGFVEGVLSGMETFVGMDDTAGM